MTLGSLRFAPLLTQSRLQQRPLSKPARKLRSTSRLTASPCCLTAMPAQQPRSASGLTQAVPCLTHRLRCSPLLTLCHRQVASYTCLIRQSQLKAAHVHGRAATTLYALLTQCIFIDAVPFVLAMRSPKPSGMTPETRAASVCGASWHSLHSAFCHVASQWSFLI